MSHQKLHPTQTLETRLWTADSIRRQKSEKIEVDPMTGAVTISRSANADPVFNQVRLLSDIQTDLPPSQRGKLGTYLGSIDGITAAQWSKECGHAIGTREFAQYAKKKLVSGDWAHYRAAPVKRLFSVR